MSKFIQYVEDVMLVESCVSELNEEQILELHEELEVIEEFLKIGKFADKLKKFSDKQDKNVEDAKKAIGDAASKARKYAGETAEKAVDVAKGMTKDAVSGAWKHGSEIGKSHLEIAQSLASRFAKISNEAKEGLKKMFSKIKDANEDQKKVLADLAGIIERIENKKTVSGADGIRMLAAAMSMGPSGEIPSYKKYVKQLEALRTIPMFSTYKVSMKKI